VGRRSVDRFDTAVGVVGILLILAAIAVVFLASGCTRLSRVEADVFPGARYLDATSGVRLRLGERTTVDLMGGTRTDLDAFVSRPTAQAGARVALFGSASLYGRVDYVPPEGVSGLMGIEVEW